MWKLGFVLLNWNEFSMFIRLCLKAMNVLELKINTGSYLTIVKQAQPVFLSYQKGNCQTYGVCPDFDLVRRL